MQRSAVRLVLALSGPSCLLVALGCATPQHSAPAHAHRPDPDPLLTTNQPPPAWLDPARKLPPLPPPPAKHAERPATTRLDTAALTPRAGLKPDHWRVIVVHHSAAESATPRSMHRFHLSKGWENGLGYHFVIGNGVKYPDGQIYVGPRWHRQITGAHCKTAPGRFLGRWRPKNFFNKQGIGICLIGQFDQTPPTPKQLVALEALIRYLCSVTNIPITEIYGHGEITHRTACPGRYLNVRDVRQAVRDMPRGRYGAVPAGAPGAAIAAALDIHCYDDRSLWQAAENLPPVLAWDCRSASLPAARGLSSSSSASATSR